MRSLGLLILVFVASCRTVTNSETRVNADAHSQDYSGTNNKSVAINDAEQELRERLRIWDLTTPCPAEKRCLTLLQVNNIYEIAAVGGSTLGGLDRVATLRRLLAEHEPAGPVLFAHSGDFVSPSGMSILSTDNNKPWAGRQNIATLKAAGLNIAILGGRDIDLPSGALQERLNEASTNSIPNSQSCDLSDGERMTQATSNTQAPSRAEWPKKSDASIDTSNYPALRPISVSASEILCQGMGCPSSRATALLHAYNPCIQHIQHGQSQSQNCVQWIASNLVQRPDTQGPRLASAAQPLKAAGIPLPRALVLEAGQAPASIRIGLMGLTLSDNRSAQFAIYDATLTAQQLARIMREKQGELPAVDALVALTQLESADNLAILEDVPGIDLILAGYHPHETKMPTQGQNLQCISEAPRRCVSWADSNARSVYVHRLIIDPSATNRSDRLHIKSKLINIDASIPEDPKVANLIACYYRQADKLLSQESKESRQSRVESDNPSNNSQAQKTSISSAIAHMKNQALDGTTRSIQRLGGSNLTDFIGQAMLDSVSTSNYGQVAFKLALVNSGLIGLMDQLGPGTLRYYDALRVLPLDSGIVPMRTRLRDLATILHQNWIDQPLYLDALLHTYPRLAVTSRPRQEISRKAIEDNLLEVSGEMSINSSIDILVPEAWLQLIKNTTPESLKTFVPIDTTSQPQSLRDIFVEALRRQFPIEKRITND